MDKSLAHDVLDGLTQIFPDFTSYWRSEGDIFREQDGTFTPCGLFLVFTGFVRGHYGRFNPEVIDALVIYLEECMDWSKLDLHNDVATCFLENLTDEPFSEDLRSHLRGRALEYFSQFA